MERWLRVRLSTQAGHSGNQCKLALSPAGSSVYNLNITVMKLSKLNKRRNQPLKHGYRHGFSFMGPSVIKKQKQLEN